MDFKFNFAWKQKECCENKCTHDADIDLDTKKQSLEFNPDLTIFYEDAVSQCEGFTTVKIADQHYQFVADNSLCVQNLQIQKHAVKLILPTEVKAKLCLFQESEKFLEAIEHSDLIPDVYEGGLKVWECAHDLALYIDQHSAILPGMKVLELGCGAGLPGILAIKYGAIVDFQDFNYEVLNLLTIPNVLLNIKDTNIVKDCKFIAGDWELIDKCIYDHNNAEENKYDVILTSETIYNPKNQIKLLNLMKHSLKTSGVIYLAAKTYYFGVGGGIRQFEDLVKNSGAFTIQPCKIIAGGVQREILCMKFSTALECS